MTLRVRVFLTLGVVLLGLLVTLYLVAGRFMLASYAALERRIMVTNMNRVEHAIGEQLSGLAATAGDWALWDETYAFMVQRDAAYIDRNLTDGAIQNLGLDWMVLCDPAGQVVCAKVVGAPAALTGPEVQRLQAIVDQNRWLLAVRAADDARSGLALAGDRPVLLASRPILTSARTGTSRGALIVARTLGPDRIQDLAQATQLEVRWLSRQDLASGAFPVRTDRSAPGDEPVVTPTNDEVITAYKVLASPAGQPVGALSVVRVRDIYNQGQRAAWILFVSVLGTGMLFWLVFSWVLNRLVLGRVERLSGGVAGIRHLHQPRDPLRLGGQDELARLSQEIDAMLTALDRSESEVSRLASALEQSSEPLFLTNRLGQVEYVNRAFEQFFGVQRGAVLGRPADEVLVNPVEFERSDALGVVADGEPFEVEFTCPAAGGRSATVLLTLSPIRGSDGGISGLLGVVRDLTRERSLEADLLHAQKMRALGTLASGAAHDFDNVLTALRFNLEHLRRVAPPDAEVAAAVAGMGESLKLAAGISRALVSLGRKVPLRRRDVLLGEVLRQTEQTLQSLLPARVALNVRVPEDDPLWVWGDPAQLQQVLLDLATNARDAMPQGGTLSITLARGGDADRERLPGPAHGELVARICVSDTGGGIAPEHLPRIFEPYFTTKARGQGTGLGLSIVHGIVADHGGAVLVDSRVGEGTTVTVLLPALPDGTGSAADRRVAVPRRVVVAMANPASRALIASGLEAERHAVREAVSVAQGLELARAAPTDVVVLDVTAQDRGLGARLCDLCAQVPGLWIVILADPQAPPRLEGLGERVRVLSRPFTVAQVAECLAELPSPVE